MSRQYVCLCLQLILIHFSFELCFVLYQKNFIKKETISFIGINQLKNEPIKSTRNQRCCCQCRCHWQPPKIFKLNVDCFEEIFNYLAIHDIFAMGETCTRMQNVAGYYFQQNFPDAVGRPVTKRNSDHIYLQGNMDIPRDGFISDVTTLANAFLGKFFGRYGFFSKLFQWIII